METTVGLLETRLWPVAVRLLDVGPERVDGSDGMPLVEETLVEEAPCLTLRRRRGHEV